MVRGKDQRVLVTSGFASSNYAEMSLSGLSERLLATTAAELALQHRAEDAAPERRIDEWREPEQSELRNVRVGGEFIV